MSEASVTKHHSRALLVDQAAVEDLQKIITEFQRRARHALLVSNEIGESKLIELETQGADEDIPIKEQLRLDSIGRTAQRIAEVSADIELENRVKITKVPLAEIASHSGVGPRAIKELTITAGEWGGSHLSLSTRNEGTFSAFWRVSGDLENVELTDAKLQQFVVQFTRPWWMLNTFGAGIGLLILPLIVAAVTFLVLSLANVLSVQGMSWDVAASHTFANLRPYGNAFGVFWFAWAVGSAFLQTKIWRMWNLLFPRADFRLGANSEASRGRSKLRAGVLSFILAAFVAPYVVPMLAQLFGGD